MNATQGMKVKVEGISAHLLGAPATARTQQEQRENTRAIFRKKYDTMLDIAELIVSLQLSAARDQKQEKTIGDLQSLIDQTREGLHISKSAIAVSTE